MGMQKITKGYPNWDAPYNENVDEYNNTIGNEELLTKNKTIKGAINEIKNVADDVTTLDADISNIKKNVAENTSKLNDIINNPCMKYSSNSDLSVLNETWSTIFWDNKIFDTDEFIAEGGDYFITFKKSGLYIVTAGVLFNLDTAEGTRNIKILKDEVEIIGYDSRNAWSNNNTRSNLTIIHYFNANEKIQISVYQDSGRDVTVKVQDGFPNISIARIKGAF